MWSGPAKRVCPCQWALSKDAMLSRGVFFKVNELSQSFAEQKIMREEAFAEAPKELLLQGLELNRNHFSLFVVVSSFNIFDLFMAFLFGRPHCEGPIFNLA